MSVKVFTFLLFFAAATRCAAQEQTPAGGSNAAAKKESKSGSRKHKQEIQVAEKKVTPESRIEEQVQKLIQLQLQKDPANPPTPEQASSWRSQLWEGADFLILSGRINQAAPVPAAPPVDPDAPRMEFPGGNVFNYGDVPERDEPVAHEFEFFNTGKKPLIIQEAHGSCGCTVPSFSREPVLPGQKGVITVKYTTKGRPGPINKDVSVSSNGTPALNYLHITGNVIASSTAVENTDKKPIPAAPPAVGTGTK